MSNIIPPTASGNVQLDPLDQNTNVNAYQYNFINLRKAEPSFGLPSELTYTVANSAYYFPVITDATTYRDSRKFSNNNDSLVLFNDNIGIGTATPNKRLTVVGVISATGRLYADKLPYFLEDNTYAIHPVYGNNTATGDHSYIGSGLNNSATDTQSIVIGGTHNQAISGYSVVVGGFYNTSSGYASVVNGGSFNQAIGDGTTINGGGYNQVTGATSTIGGGSYNEITSNNSVIAGGSYNQIVENFDSFIGGGAYNQALGNGSVIGGGYLNLTYPVATVLGGVLNCTNFYSVVGGGFQNTASGYQSTVVSGQQNTASGYYSSITSGVSGCVTGSYATVGGGICNWIDSTSSSYYFENTTDFSNIVGGKLNCIMGTHSNIVGGCANFISGNYSGILGGQNNCIRNNNSFTLGSALSSYDDDTTYTNNLTVSGSLWAPNGSTGSAYYSTTSGYAYDSYTSTFTLTASYDTTGRALSSIGEAASIYQYGVNDSPYYSIEPKNGNNHATAYYSAIMGGHDNVAKDCNSFVIGSNIITLQKDTAHVNNLLSLSSVKSTIFEGTSGLSFDGVHGGMGGFIDISGGNSGYFDNADLSNGGNGGYITLKGSDGFQDSLGSDAGFINLNAGQLINAGSDPLIQSGKGGYISGKGGNYTGSGIGVGSDAGYISFNAGDSYDLAIGGSSGCIILDGGEAFADFGGRNGGSGGFIDLRGSGGAPIGNGGNGGCLIMSGAVGANGGSINTSADTYKPGGSIDTSINGGSINTSHCGGSIITNGSGCIGLGTSSDYTQTMLCGTATSNRTICFPDNDGIIIAQDTSNNIKNYNNNNFLCSSWFTNNGQDLGGSGISSTNGTIFGTANVIGADSDNYYVFGINTVSNSSILGGYYNSITVAGLDTGYAGNNSIVAGSNNTIHGGNYGNASNNIIGAGYKNSIASPSQGGNGADLKSNTILNGDCNTIYADNNISTINSTIVNGVSGYICANYSTILNGSENTINSYQGDGDHSSILGGCKNTIANNCNVFILGSNITSSKNDTTFVNNLSTTNSIYTSSILGSGSEVVLSDGISETGNGTNTLSLNFINGVYTSNDLYIGGSLYGDISNASGIIYTRGIGSNSIKPASTNNTTSGDYSFIGSGSCNTVSGYGDCSAILGGHDNNLYNSSSFIIGSNITTSADCTTYVNNLEATGCSGTQPYIILADSNGTRWKIGVDTSGNPIGLGSV